MNILTNAFSINMLTGTDSQVSFTKLTANQARSRLEAGFVSAIGHADTAVVVGNDLDLEVIANRMSVNAYDYSADDIIVAQYSGPRLPEGSTTLPDGADIVYWLVEVQDSARAE